MKKRRHAKILELISNNEIETQEELQALLHDAGFEVTQATISRDIRRLGIRKVVSAEGRQYYVAGDNTRSGSIDNYARILKEGFRSADTAGNILVIRTLSGLASGVAAALDAMDLEGLVGTIAGDDTIMIAIKTPQEAENIKKIIEGIARK